MRSTKEDRKVIIPRVTKYGPKPRSAKQTLIQAHALLCEEGVWEIGTFFKDGDPKEAYENSSCGSWSACAMGAIGIVTGETPVVVIKQWDDHDTEDLLPEWQGEVSLGLTRSSFDEWVEAHPWKIELLQRPIYGFDENVFVFNADDTPRSVEAATALAKFIDPMALGDELESGVEIVITMNDSSVGRTRVLEFFEGAIRALGGTPIGVRLMHEGQDAIDAATPAQRTALARLRSRCSIRGTILLTDGTLQVGFESIGGRDREATIGADGKRLNTRNTWRHG